MSNTKLWDAVCVTDPSAVKPITGKQYQGSSPKPYWIVRKATEQFGPCGIGWGLTILDERIERFGETDSVHIAKVKFWYVLDGKRGEVEQMGQTKMSYKTSKGSVMLDEDAPKKSVTDALIKCMSLIGFAGDIFAGRWDDSGYVQWAGQETERREAAKHEDANKGKLEAINKSLGDAAKLGKDALQAAWKAMGKDDRALFGGASKVSEIYGHIATEADEAKKPLAQRLAEAKDLDTLYLLGNSVEDLSAEETAALEKRQAELKG